MCLLITISIKKMNKIENDTKGIKIQIKHLQLC